MRGARGAFVSPALSRRNHDADAERLHPRQERRRGLERAIRSVRELDVETEILVADDSQSRDGTSALARSLGARVFQVVWQHDFAAARNLLLDAARGQWLFWLDTDEALQPESRAELVRSIQQVDALGFTVLRQDLIDADRPQLFTVTTVLKLLRPRPEIRYAGRIHERPEPALHQIANELGMRVAESSIAVRHWGYIGAKRMEKHRRNVALLEMELADRPGQLYQEIELGRTLLLLGDERGHEFLATAARKLREHLDDPAPPTPLAALLLEYALQRTEVGGLSADDAESAARRWFPLSPPLLWWIARRRFAAADYESAAALLEQLLRLDQTRSYDRTISFDPRILDQDARLNLAVAYLRLGRLDDAEGLLRALAPDPRTAAAAALNLDAVAQLRRLSAPSRDDF